MAFAVRTLRVLMTSVLAFAPLYFRPAMADPTPSPTFANYGFASELGSGVYSINGRTVQIYQIPLKFQFREAAPQGAAPGINFVVPLTLGFFDFQTKDVAQLKVPNQIAELSVEPGVELDYWLSNVWHVYPYAKGGGAFASSSASNIADLYFHPPSASALGITRQALQFETGVMLGVSPMWQIHGITLPRIGISYRVAGAFSGWRLGIGDPF